MHALEEIAERKREKLKTLCQTLENNENLTAELYDDMAITSFYLEQNLKGVEWRINYEKKTSVGNCKQRLGKKAQSFI